MIRRTAFEESVWEALSALEATVASVRPPAPNPGLRPALARVETLVGQIPPETDPQLRHYLQRGSWQKARAWLAGVREEAGL